MRNFANIKRYNTGIYIKNKGITGKENPEDNERRVYFKYENVENGRIDEDNSYIPGLTVKGMSLTIKTDDNVITFTNGDTIIIDRLAFKITSVNRIAHNRNLRYSNIIEYYNLISLSR